MGLPEFLVGAFVGFLIADVLGERKLIGMFQKKKPKDDEKKPDEVKS